LEVKMAHNLQIGHVAQQTGLTVDAIRFYEKERLLPKALRSAGGFRLYGSDHIEQLRFIQKAQTIGFSLGEIRELILIQDDQVETCSHVRDVIRQKLATVQQKMNELAQIEGQLKEALQKCNRQLRKTSARHDRCPVLDLIASSENAKESKRL
jgi:DNA-binding transcriptional MerR regulator